MKQPQLAPLETFVQHSTSLLSAQIYLLQAQTVSVKEEHKDLSDSYKALRGRVRPAYSDPTAYFLSRLFISYVSAFEFFLQDTVVTVVSKHPKKVGSVTFSLAEILDATSPETLVTRATEEWLNKALYKKPSEYLKEITTILSIDDGELQEDWKVFVEAKARRDVGVHNDWKCNSTYLRKLQEAGLSTSSQIGSLLVPAQDPYLKTVVEALLRLASKISAKVIFKHWPDTDMTQLRFDPPPDV